MRPPLSYNKILEVKGMRRLATFIAVLALVSASTVVLAQGFKKISEFLTGYEEVPSVSTTGNGNFSARISNDESRIDWELTYSDLEGTIQQAHIHIGNVGVNGGISVFLCTNLGNGPAGIQPCPAPPATISGTILAADVSPNIPATLAARNQGLNTGEIDELVRAIRAGATYVNVHSTTWPGGEIRSQIDGNSSHNH
jgi:CHRD domain